MYVARGRTPMSLCVCVVVGGGGEGGSVGCSVGYKIGQGT
jgi:hypothetical protein